MRTRNAILPDAQHIHDLIASYSVDGTLLPRTLAEICENVRDFVVLEEDARIIGCGALHLYGLHLAEIRSITVATNAATPGRRDEVWSMRCWRKRRSIRSAVSVSSPGHQNSLPASVLTVAQREDLPDKIYKDCWVCPRFHHCDEVAMVRGELPKFAILPEPANWLVKLQV